MLSVEQIIAYFERAIAEKHLAGERQELLHLQYAAGLLMKAAQDAGDNDIARRFRVLAAEAANRREELSGGA